MKEHRDASGRLSIDLDPNSHNFKKFASRLESEVNAKEINRLDGLDERYWDYDVEGTTIVLHSNVSVGVSIHVEDGSRDELLRSVAERIGKEQ